MQSRRIRDETTRVPHPCLSRFWKDRVGKLVGKVTHHNVPRTSVVTSPHALGTQTISADARNLHFITFSCYHRAPLLGTPEARRVFEQTLENVRQWYALYVTGYVVMPEHVHLLISEPERGTLAIAIQMLKQITAHQLKATADALRESPLRMTE